MENKRKQIMAAIFFAVLLSIPAFSACDSQRGRFYLDGTFGTIGPSGVNVEAVENSITQPDSQFQSFRPRQYNPQLGRFMQRDPLGVVPNAILDDELLYNPILQYKDDCTPSFGPF